MSAIMDRVDADNFMDRVNPNSFADSIKLRFEDETSDADGSVDSTELEFEDDTVDVDGFVDNIKLGFEDDTIDADSFVDSIELEFEDDPSRYKKFINIMKAYKKSRLGDSEVVIKICELLVGYPSLVKEFNAFLPNGYFLVPSDMREEGDPFITLKTPEGESVYPRDYTRKPLASGASSSSH